MAVYPTPPFKVMNSKKLKEIIESSGLLDVMNENLVDPECLVESGMSEEVANKHREFGSLSEEQQIRMVKLGEI